MNENLDILKQQLNALESISKKLDIIAALVVKSAGNNVNAEIGKEQQPKLYMFLSEFGLTNEEIAAYAGATKDAVRMSIARHKKTKK